MNSAIMTLIEEAVAAATRSVGLFKSREARLEVLADNGNSHLITVEIEYVPARHGCGFTAEGFWAHSHKGDPNQKDALHQIKQSASHLKDPTIEYLKAKLSTARDAEIKLTLEPFSASEAARTFTASSKSHQPDWLAQADTEL